jgi:hypothetical protein
VIAQVAKRDRQNHARNDREADGFLPLEPVQGGGRCNPGAPARRDNILSSAQWSVFPRSSAFFSPAAHDMLFALHWTEALQG